MLYLNKDFKGSVSSSFTTSQRDSWVATGSCQVRFTKREKKFVIGRQLLGYRWDCGPPSPKGEEI